MNHCTSLLLLRADKKERHFYNKLNHMKAKKLGMLMLFAVAILAIPACKKKSEDPKPAEETPVVEQGTAQAKVDGKLKSWPATFYTENQAVVFISALDADGVEGMNVIIDDVFPGDYDVNGTSVMAFYISGGSKQIATKGKITVTKSEGNKLSGTFYFEKEVNGGIKITEGVFTDVRKK
jgi:hypothetical protein